MYKMKDKENLKRDCLGTGCRSREPNKDKISCVCVCIISEFLFCFLSYKLFVIEILLTLLISILVFMLPSCNA